MHHDLSSHFPFQFNQFNCLKQPNLFSCSAMSYHLLPISLGLTQSHSVDSLAFRPICATAAEFSERTGRYYIQHTNLSVKTVVNLTLNFFGLDSLTLPYCLCFVDRSRAEGHFLNIIYLCRACPEVNMIANPLHHQCFLPPRRHLQSFQSRLQLVLQLQSNTSTSLLLQW